MTTYSYSRWGEELPAKAGGSVFQGLERSEYAKMKMLFLFTVKSEHFTLDNKSPASPWCRVCVKTSSICKWTDDHSHIENDTHRKAVSGNSSATVQQRPGAWINRQSHGALLTSVPLPIVKNQIAQKVQ